MSELLGEGGAAAVAGALVGGFIVGLVNLLAQLLAARQQRRHQNADAAVDAATKATEVLHSSHPQVLASLGEGALDTRRADLVTRSSDARASLTRVMVGHHAANVREAAQTSRDAMAFAVNYAFTYAGWGESEVALDTAKRALHDAEEALDNLTSLLQKRR